MLTCQICKKEFEQITGKHLAKHNITPKEYKNKFNISFLISEKSQLQKVNKIKIWDVENSRNAWNKGVVATDKQKEKHSKIMKQKYASGELQHWNKGKHWSKEVKDKISNTLVGKSYWTDEIHKKRNITIQNKIDNGWESLLKNRPLIGKHKRQSSERLIRANKDKSKRFYESIKFILNKENIEILSHNYNFLELFCNTCNSNFSKHKQYFYDCKIRKDKFCPICYPRERITSQLETDIFEYIKSLESTATRNNRSILEGKEIDIFLPGKNIGFEVAGLYWHSENVYAGSKEHILHKMQFAFKKSVQLYTIFEDEWINKRGIVKSEIAHILDKSSKDIFVEECYIKTISENDKDNFLNNNHLRSSIVAKYCYGAFYNNELVAVMVFDEIDNNIFEMSRFAITLDTNILGIDKRLFKQFIENLNPKIVIGYADRRWSTGNLYKQLGFTFDSVISPAYWCILPNRIERYHCDELKSFYPLLTEYDRIWDCGNTKWIWTNQAK